MSTVQPYVMLLASTMGERTGLSIPVKLLVVRGEGRGGRSDYGGRDGEGARGRGRGERGSSRVDIELVD